MSPRLLIVGWLAGCGLGPDPALTTIDLTTLTPSEVAANLSQVTGCSDVALFAGSADGTALLSLSHRGMVEEAYSTMAEQLSDSWTLPSPEVFLTLDLGSGLLELPCNDALTDDPVIVDTLAAVSGSVELTVVRTSDTWEAWDMPADAEAVLRDVVLESETSGDRVELGDMRIAARVGWLPG